MFHFATQCDACFSEVHPMPTTVHPGPFFSTPEQRRALARQRYFEEGLRPSGLVSEPVIQSWSRCMHARRRPQERIAFEPVTPSRVHGTLARSAALRQAAAPELGRLDSMLAGTRCRALLTDGDGIVVHSTPGQGTQGALLPVAARIGVNLAESVVGTTAPGVVARTGSACTVLGGEHFFDAVQAMHCAAAPIRDIHGRLAGVLDVSVESRPFGFDAASLVGLSAMAIENRLLRSQSEGLLVLQFQTMPALLDGPFEGLAGVDDRGRVAWINGTGARIVGCEGGEAQTLFGCATNALLGLLRADAARPLTLPNGLNVWIRGQLRARDGQTAPVLPVAARAQGDPPPARPCAEASGQRALSLGEHDRALIERTLLECRGNISRAARRLGVSRGLLYRRLRGEPKHL